ncbi:MIZ zinc finger domain protein [Aspergillus stella-maris]|uniref:MIZ zinc finger domain protein n=1 Tax=Aspergillus stella-maris TaxID=1810926 RepID=UPI003CCCF21A
MVRSLGIMSVVLQYNIFLCLCRRVPNAKLESQLQDIFVKDLDYFKRSVVASVSHEQRVRENNEILSLYHRAVGTMSASVRGQVAAVPAQGIPVPSQAAPTSGPTAVALNAPSPSSYTSPYSQPHTGAHGPNGVTPVAVGSPVVGFSARLSQRPSSRQSLTQQRGAGAHGHQLQVTGAISPQATANTPQSPARLNTSQRQFAQQPAPQQQQPGPQIMGPTQSPAHLTHILAGGRMPASSPQYARPVTPQQLQQRRGLTSFLPQAGAPPVINTRPDPNRSAIHQADLRDPVNQLFVVDENGEKKQTELLPLLTSFAVAPNILRQPDRSFKWWLPLSASELNDCVSYKEQGMGKRMLRTAVNGSQLYRLRCIKVHRSTTELSEHSWVVAETTWPTAIYIQVNGKDVRPRRKIHNTRDLPLDITPYLQKDLNQIDIGFILTQAEPKDSTYAVAVERLMFGTLAFGKTLAQPLAAPESQKRICGRLQHNPADEDDELSIVSDDLKINLVDPYTARLFEVPVRGAHCEHTECFDHDTFLQTRLLKFGDSPAVEADWRCPICRQDARPQKLIVDEFLAHVRKELERTDRCEGARTLQIKADGSWDVKHDEDHLSEPPTPQLSRTSTKRKLTALENGVNQRPKIDPPVSTTDAVSNAVAPVICLD